MSEKADLTRVSRKKEGDSFAHKLGVSTSQSIESPVEQILCFQRTIGNQAVQRLINSSSILTKFQSSGNPLIQKQDRGEPNIAAFQHQAAPQKLHTQITRSNATLGRKGPQVLPKTWGSGGAMFSAERREGRNPSLVT